MTPEISDHIDRYSPKHSRDKLTKDHWHLIADLVREATRLTCPPTKDVATHTCSRVARFASWAVNVIGEPTLDTLFTERNIQRFIATLPPRANNHSDTAAKYRAVMRAVRGEQPRPKGKGVHTSANPYSKRQLAEIRAWCSTRRTPAQRSTALASFALGVGAGLRPEEVVRVRPADITVDDGVLAVRVRGAVPRTVPVASSCADILLDLVAESRDPREPLIDVARNSRGLVDFRALGPAPLAVNARRFRATWMVAALKVLTPPEAVRMAGLQTLSGLQLYLPLIPDTSPAHLADKLGRLSF